MKDLSVMRRTAAEIFACSLLEVFPDIRLVGGCETVNGFVYDFEAPFAFQDTFLRMIEEKMREVVKKEQLIEISEMMPENAADLFEHRNQPLQAELARKVDNNLLSIVRIGGFTGPGAGPFLNATDELGAFKLLEFRIQKGVTRVFGVVALDKKELKGLIKKGSPLNDKNHLAWGQDLDLFSSSPFLDQGHFVWHPEGLAVCESLKKALTKEKFQTISTPTAFTNHPKEERLRHFFSFFQDHPDSSRLLEWSVDHTPEEEREEGLLTPKFFTTDLALIKCAEGELNEACFSSLQLIIKILKILSFEYRVLLHPCSSKKKMEPFLSALKLGEWEYQVVPTLSRDPRIEVLIADGIGRFWKNSMVELVTQHDGKQKTVGIASSVFVKLERTIALLLESHDGALPFWLAPKQIRLLVVDEIAVTYARELEAELKNEGYRIELIEASKESLSSKMHQGLAKQVPYMLVVGKRELSSATVTVRKRESKEKKTMKLADFLEILHNREERL